MIVFANAEERHKSLNSPEVLSLVRAIVHDDPPEVTKLLGISPFLARECPMRFGLLPGSLRKFRRHELEITPLSAPVIETGSSAQLEH
jgi:hypothetical protein